MTYKNSSNQINFSTENGRRVRATELSVLWPMSYENSAVTVLVDSMFMKLSVFLFILK